MPRKRALLKLLKIKLLACRQTGNNGPPGVICGQNAGKIYNGFQLRQVAKRLIRVESASIKQISHVRAAIEFCELMLIYMHRPRILVMGRLGILSRVREQFGRPVQLQRLLVGNSDLQIVLNEPAKFIGTQSVVRWNAWGDSPSELGVWHAHQSDHSRPCFVPTYAWGGMS